MTAWSSRPAAVCAVRRSRRRGGVFGRHPGGGNRARPRLGEIVRDMAAPTIAVVGAGFTGIELALELRDRLAAHGADGQPSGCASS